MNIEERIRQRAYEIWDAEGRPDGQEAEHWQRARDEIEPYEQEGDALPGSIESGVAVPMSRRER
ncbi:DUF2934 domain-containing protein [Stutzerimonas degradans]|uniref:DUF2934 domain-containing protein n=1 Tax=Stutzerimonas degradans TaxID=2968968 RepID=A0A8E2QF63_9GAMM|nr:DUF2934 domain-containing protein [Stutzerimonas degradans]MCQ4273762.1 DUF2934 domain-containing protein [Stutzerimonas degradans]PNF77542.1 hypothetical protein CXK95_07600 [Stutzerimonas degradans]QPT20908.1 DUF2934 domain-containing protein [Stutzerimonas degradans]